MIKNEQKNSFHQEEKAQNKKIYKNEKRESVNNIIPQNRDKNDIIKRFSNIPDELKNTKQWVLWKQEKRRGKSTKVPYSTSNIRASSTDSSTWSSFQEVIKRYKESPFYDGIGFMFSADDPYCGIDIDDGIINGRLTDIAEEIINSLNSYTEFSPSKTGFHIIVRATKLDESMKKNVKKNIEMYDKERYFTFTGDVFQSKNTIHNRQEEINNLTEKYFQRKTQVDKKQRGQTRKVYLNDDELWERLFKHKSFGEKVKAMYEGDHEHESLAEFRKENGEPDYSSIDQSLCNYLAIATKGDAEKIDSMFRQSGLMRKKWEREDYRESTINNAIENYNESNFDLFNEEKLTQSQKLFELANNNTYFHTPEGIVYAQVKIGDHYENWRVNNERFKNWLRLEFHKREGKTPGNQAVQDTVNQLIAYTQFNPKLKEEIHLRVAGDFNTIYVDLANDDWEVVKITKDGWEITKNPDVKFKREKSTLELPRPVRDGNINELRRFVNVSDEEYPLSLAYLISAYHPTGPYPILIIQGEQGSAKSTHTRILKDLIDPSVADIRALPRDEEGIAVAGNHSWCVAFDNLSGLSNYLADVLCRMSTGGAITGRELYTNDGEHIFSLKRPIILNGIDDIVSRGDLGDRSVVINLPTIPEHKRREESKLWEEFREAKPRILGAIFDILSETLKNLPYVELDSLPRMADFAKWAVAAEKACGIKEGEFMKVYNQNRKETAESSISNDLVAAGIINIMSRYDEWRGNSTKLLRELQEVLPIGSKLPAVNRLKSRVERAKPLLRHEGIEITQNKRRVFTIKRLGVPEDKRNKVVQEEDAPTIKGPHVSGWCLEDDGRIYTKDLSENVQAVMFLKHDGLIKLGARYWENGIYLTEEESRQEIFADGVTQDTAIKWVDENQGKIIERMSQEPLAIEI